MGMLHGRQQAFRLHSWSLLPAAARESLAGDGRDPGLRRALPRLERAHLRRVLRHQRRGPRRQHQKPDHAHREQLRAHQLQLRPHAAELAQGECAAHLSHDPGRRAPQPQELQGPQLGHGAGLQPHHHAAGQPPRPHHADSLGHRRLSSITTASRRRACGWPRPRPTPRRWSCWPSTASSSPCWRRTSASASAPLQRRRGALDRHARRQRRHHPSLSGALRVRRLDCRLLLRWPDLARHRL